MHLALFVDLADFGFHRFAVQQRVYRRADIALDGDAGEGLDFDEGVEGGGCFAFEDRFAGAAAAGFFVGEGDSLDAADEVGEGGVEHEVGEGVAVGGGDELDAALGDGACGEGFEFGADFVDHDHFGHVVFDGFDHDGVLAFGGFDLHAAGAPDAGVGDIAVAGDFVGGVDDDDALALMGEDAGDFAEEGGFADAGSSEQEDAGAGGDEVFDQGDGAADGAPDAHGETNDFASAVADAGDAVEGAGDAGAVVVAEFAELADDFFEFGGGDFGFGELDFALAVAGAGATAEVEDDFEQGVEFVLGFDGAADGGGEGLEEGVDVVDFDLRGCGGRGRIGLLAALEWFELFEWIVVLGQVGHGCG